MTAKWEYEFGSLAAVALSYPYTAYTAFTHGSFEDGYI